MSKYIPSNKKIFTKEQTQDIIYQYLNGTSSVKIGKQYNCGHHVILNLLHENGIESNNSRSHRKYALNENYFDTIDTPNKAYILGFLYADGNNSPQKSTIALYLQEEDREILEKMRVEIGSEKPLVFADKSNKHDFGYNYKNQYGLVMFDKHMCNELINKGVVPNKSLVTTFPTFLRTDLFSHFIRGVYDGDGSIYRYIRNEKNKPITVTITATNDFCKALQKICKETLDINAGIYDASCHNGITKVFTLSGKNSAKKFLDWIYQDAELFLQRKYDRYIDYYNLNDSLSA